MAIDKATFLAPRDVPTRTVDLPGFGPVDVRGLTRGEQLRLSKLGEKDMAEAEIQLISMVLVDPQVTVDEARQWYQSVSAGVLTPISEAVEEMSGTRPTALKEEITQFRG